MFFAIVLYIYFALFFTVSHRQLVHIMSTAVRNNRNHRGLRACQEPQSRHFYNSHYFSLIAGCFVRRYLRLPSLRDCPDYVFVRFIYIKLDEVFLL